MVDVKVGLSEPPRAEGGNLEVDLPELLVDTALTARAADTSILILNDGAQFLSEDEPKGLILALHCSLLLTISGAGLPQMTALAGEANSYAERLFEFPVVAALLPDPAA